MSYSVLYTVDGATRDISDFVTGIQYGGENKSAVRKLDVSLICGTDSYIPNLELRNGALLTLFRDEKELLRTVIFKQDKDHKGSLKVTGYTQGIYLTKNKDTKKFVQVTASQVAHWICSEFNIPVGEIVDTRILLEKFIVRDKTLWDILLMALTQTASQSGIKYRVYFKEGKLNICEKSTQYVPFILEGGTNLLSASRSSSIEEMKNQVKVTGKLPRDNSEELVCIVKNEEMQRLYGVLQEYKEESGDKVTPSEIKRVADNMLKELCKEQIELNVEALGLDDAEAGMAVYVVEPISGITGTYYIDQDDHTIDGNKHTMRLKLSFTDEVPELQYEAPHE